MLAIIGRTFLWLGLMICKGLFIVECVMFENHGGCPIQAGFDSYFLSSLK